MEVFANQPQKQATVFKYSTPEIQQGKTIKWLCKSDIVYAGVQVIASGGENNMHSHSGQDGVFIVLKGRARFYGENDVLIAEVGPLEGVLIPRDLHYWFESSSEEVLELLQVESLDKRIKNVRTDYTPRMPGREANGPHNMDEKTSG